METKINTSPTGINPRYSGEGGAAPRARYSGRKYSVHTGPPTHAHAREYEIGRTKEIRIRAGLRGADESRRVSVGNRTRVYFLNGNGRVTARPGTYRRTLFRAPIAGGLEKNG